MAITTPRQQIGTMLEAETTKRASSKWLSALAYYVPVGLIGLVFFFPFFWTVSSSFKNPPEIFMYPPLLFPGALRFENYGWVFRNVPFLAWFVNTSLIVVLGLTGTVLSSSIVAYAFARFDYPGKDLLFMITLATMMIPSHVTLIPQFILFHKLGWLDTIKPLWVPSWFGGGAFNIFLLRQFIMTLPRDLDEAAFIDGASYLHIFLRVLIPLCKPVLATVAVLRFIWGWNDFMGPLLYLNSPEKLTLSVGLRFLAIGPQEPGLPKNHYLMAACTMAILPCIILFFLAQRYFVQGIVMSGIKG